MPTPGSPRGGGGGHDGHRYGGGAAAPDYGGQAPPPPVSYAPPPITVPLETTVSILSLSGIDTVAQTVAAEFSVVCVARGARGRLPKDFNPEFRVLNRVCLTEEGEKWRVEDGEDVKFGWRAAGVFAQTFELRRFPFDEQARRGAARRAAAHRTAWRGALASFPLPSHARQPPCALRPNPPKQTLCPPARRRNRSAASSSPARGRTPSRRAPRASCATPTSPWSSCCRRARRRAAPKARPHAHT